MKHLVILAIAVLGLAVASPALAWTWPVDGEIVRAYAFGSDPYAAGQHRGIDIASSLGTEVRAPASGVVTFRGFVPSGGTTLTITTADGYAVTLQQLGAITVAKGTSVTEGAIVASVGASSDSTTAHVHVHLGVRLAADRQAYLDPFSLLGPGSSGAGDAPPEAAGAEDAPDEVQIETEPQPIAEPEAASAVESEPRPLVDTRTARPPVDPEAVSTPRPALEPRSELVPDPLPAQLPADAPEPPTGPADADADPRATEGADAAASVPSPRIEAPEPIEPVDPEPVEPVESTVAPAPVVQADERTADPFAVVADPVATGDAVASQANEVRVNVGPARQTKPAPSLSRVGQPAVARVSTKTRPSNRAPARPVVAEQNAAMTQPGRRAAQTPPRAPKASQLGPRFERPRPTYDESQSVRAQGVAGLNEREPASAPSSSSATAMTGLAVPELAASVAAAPSSIDARRETTSRPARASATQARSAVQAAPALASAESGDLGFAVSLLIIALGSLGMTVTIWHWRRSRQSQAAPAEAPGPVVRCQLAPRTPRCSQRGAPHARRANALTSASATRRATRRAREYREPGSALER